MARNAVGHPAEGSNVGGGERIGSAIAGTALIARAVARPSLGRFALALGGIALLQRGLLGHCPLYRALGLNTAPPRARPAAAADPVLSASEDSFPASDPPAWIPVAGTVAEH